MGTTMTMTSTQAPMPMMMRIFMSFHLSSSGSARSHLGDRGGDASDVKEDSGRVTYHICLRTRLAPRLKPWAETARVSRADGQLTSEDRGQGEGGQGNLAKPVIAESAISRASGEKIH